MLQNILSFFLINKKYEMRFKTTTKTMFKKIIYENYVGEIYLF